MITDMTTGKPAVVLWKFSFPMLVSSMFQQIYNIADSVIVGQICGDDGLAAIGASYSITMLFVSFALGCNVGCSVIISQLFGAKKYGATKTAINTSYIAVLGLSVILTIIGCILCRPMLNLLKTPDNIFSEGAAYLDIYTYGIIFLFLYNICTGIFTALGDSNTPLVFLIASSLINIALDYLFVGSLGMGVSGAAWATFISQGAAGAAAFFVLNRKVRTAVKTDEKVQHFSLPVFGKICYVAIPSILQNSFVSVGNLFVQVVVNGFGSAVIAGYSAAVKLNSFAVTSFGTMSNGLSNYTAQNIGANRLGRIRRGYKAALIMALGVSLPFLLVYTIKGGFMMSIFLKDESANAIQAGVDFLTIVAPFYPVVAIKLMTDGVHRGACAMQWFMASTFLDLIIRVVLSFVFSGIWGSTGIWMSWPFGWIIAAVLICTAYFFGAWIPKSLRRRYKHKKQAAEV
ncbi:MAG: MATE family efflux transporter [Clostridia bacterium]|nr:MATE family efflux transporter [Clostridia bacterium]